MNNINSAINSHNTIIAIATNKKDTPNNCNRRRKNECPVKGECLSEAIVYQAKATTSNKPDETYISLTKTASRPDITTIRHL